MKGQIVITVPDQGPPLLRSPFDLPTTALFLAQLWTSVVQQSIPPVPPPAAVAEPTGPERQALRKILAA